MDMMDVPRTSQSWQEPDSRRGSLAFFRFLLTFEYVFESTGHNGLYQILVLFFTSIIECSIGLTLFTVLTESVTFPWTWSCGPTGVFWNVNGTGVTKNLNWCPSIGDDCTNITYLSETTTVATEWNLICDEAHLVRLTAVLFFAGSLGGSVINGQLTDVFGRRKTTLIFWSLLMTLQALTGASTSWIMYLAFRIGAGICVGACTASNSVIALEFMGPKGRVLAAQKFGLSFALFLSSLCFFFINNWRYRAIASGLLCAPSIPVLYMFLPESARWLLQKGRTPEVEAIVRKIAQYNRKSVPNLNVLIRIEAQNKAERKGHDLYTYLDLFASRKYAIRTLSLLFIWFSQIVVMTGFESRMTELHVSLKLAILGVTMLLGKGVNIHLANRFGRKKTFFADILVVMLLTLIMLAVDVVKNLCVKINHASIILTALSALSLIPMTGVSMLAFLFVMETYPTLLRSTANGVANTFGETGGIIALYIPLLNVYHISIPYVLYFVIAAISAILVAVVMPETRGRDLQEDLPEGEQNGCCSSRCHQKGEPEFAGSTKELSEQLKETHKRDYNQDYCVLDFTKPPKQETSC